MTHRSLLKSWVLTAPKLRLCSWSGQVLGIGVFPALIGIHARYRKSGEDFGTRAAFHGKRQKSATKSYTAFATTLLVACLFGVLGKLSGITAATFVFSIIAVLMLKLVFDFALHPQADQEVGTGLKRQLSWQYNPHGRRSDPESPAGAAADHCRWLRGELLFYRQDHQQGVRLFPEGRDAHHHPGRSVRYGPDLLRSGRG